MKTLGLMTCSLVLIVTTGVSFAQEGIDKKIADDFAKLEAGTSSEASTVFGTESFANWKAPSAFVTNKLVGAAINYSLAKSQLKVSFTFPKQSVAAPAPTIVRVKPIEVQCNFCPQCGDYDFICQGKRVACMATAWPAISACETVKQASKLADGAKIMEIDFKDLELSATASSSGITAQFDDSLNPTLQLHDFAAKARLAADLTVQFEDIPGFLLACFNYPYPVSILPTDVSVTSATFDVPASLERSTADGKIKLGLKIHELKPAVHVDGNPFWDIIRANPLFTATCVIPAQIMSWGALAQLLFPITLDIPIKENELPISVGDIPVPVAGENYSVKYVPTATAIGIVATRIPVKR